METDNPDETDYLKEAKSQTSASLFERLDVLIPAIQAVSLVGNRQDPVIEKATAELIDICLPPISKAVLGELSGTRYSREEVLYMATTIALDQITTFVVERLMVGSFEYRGWRETNSYLYRGAKWKAKRLRKKICNPDLVSIDDVIECGKEPGREDEYLSKVESEPLPIMEVMNKAKLTRREMKVVLKTYIVGQTDQEIGGFSKVTSDRVRKIRSRGIIKMRKVIRRDGQGGWEYRVDDLL